MTLSHPKSWLHWLEIALWGVAILTSLAFIVIKARNWGTVAASEQFDCETYYLAAKVANLAPENLYHQDAWDEVVVLDHAVPAYVYLPTFAWILRPLAALPYDVVRRLWFWTSVAAALTTAVAMVAADRRKTVALAGAALWLLLPASLDTLFHGQVNFFVGLTVTLGILGWADKRRGLQFAGGALIGVAGAIKIFPLLLGTMTLWRRKWHFGAGCVAGLLLFVIVGMAWMPWVTWQNFAGVLVDTGNRLAPPGGGPLFHNQSVPAFWHKLAFEGQVGTTLQDRVVTFHNHPLFPASTARVGGYVSVLLLIGVTAVAAVKLYHRSRDRDAVWALVMLAAMLVSPVTWWHYPVIFAPMFPALVAVRARIPAAWRLLIPAGYLLMVAQRAVAIWIRYVPVMAMSSAMMMGLLVMWFALARYAWKGVTTEAEP